MTVLPVRTSARNSVRAKNGTVLALLCVGFALRLWLGASTYSPDAATLAWGSAHLSVGHFDPYREVVSDPQSDPIPLYSLHSLSLAQGPIGVLAGAIPLFVANQIGLTDLGENPIGRAFEVGELFAYKLSYLLPEALIVGLIFHLTRKSKARNHSLLLWATTPLAVYTWGQGLPDAWTIAVVLLAVVLLERAASSDPSKRSFHYGVVFAVILVGASWTKLLPLVMLAPCLTVFFRDRELRPSRLKALGPTLVGSSLAILPYALSSYAADSVLVRFEFNMLNARNGITSTGSELPAAYLSAFVVIAFTSWLLLVKNPIAVIRPWTSVTILVVSSMSGGITHLMVWSLVAIILLSIDRPNGAYALAGALGLSVFWHVLNYSWLADLFNGSFARKSNWTRHYEFLSNSIPGYKVIGTYVSSAAALAILGIAFILFQPTRSEFADSMRRWSAKAPTRAFAKRFGLVSVVGLVFAIVLAGYTTAVTGRSGGGVASQGRARVLLTTKPQTFAHSGRGQANTVSFRIAVESQPADEQLRFEIIRGGQTTAHAEIPLWRADALSDRGRVLLPLNKPVSITGTQVRISRIAAPSHRTDKRPPYIAMEGGKLRKKVVPAIQFSQSEPGRFFEGALRSQLRWYRLIGIPIGAIAVAFLVHAACRRTEPKQVSPRSDTSHS